MVTSMLFVIAGPAPSGERTVIDKAEAPPAATTEEENLTQPPGQRCRSTVTHRHLSIHQLSVNVYSHTQTTVSYPSILAEESVKSD